MWFLRVALVPLAAFTSWSHLRWSSLGGGRGTEESAMNSTKMHVEAVPLCGRDARQWMVFNTDNLRSSASTVSLRDRQAGAPQLPREPEAAREPDHERREAARERSPRDAGRRAAPASIWTSSGSSSLSPRPRPARALSRSLARGSMWRARESVTSPERIFSALSRSSGSTPASISSTSLGALRVEELTLGTRRGLVGDQLVHVHGLPSGPTWFAETVRDHDLVRRRRS